MGGLGMSADGGRGVGVGEELRTHPSHPPHAYGPDNVVVKGCHACSLTVSIGKKYIVRKKKRVRGPNNNYFCRYWNVQCLFIWMRLFQFSEQNWTDWVQFIRLSSVIKFTKKLIKFGYVRLPGTNHKTIERSIGVTVRSGRALYDCSRRVRQKSSKSLKKSPRTRGRMGGEHSKVQCSTKT